MVYRELDGHYLKKTSILFFIFLIIGSSTRYFRIEGIELFKNNITVAFEHIFAGFGVPAIISIIFLTIIYFRTKKNDKHQNYNVLRLMTFLIAILFAIHLSYNFEIKQACEDGGYWGKARGYVQYWQIVCDEIGIISFIIYTFNHYFKSITKPWMMNNIP